MYNKNKAWKTADLSPKKEVRVSVTLTEKTGVKLQELAFEKGLTASGVVNLLLSEYR
ncbi:MAG: hypothetical protein WCX31_14345 [Salinivirgaceae bacterium]|jgi:hypothetical protein